MNKKHFIMLAQTLKAQRPADPDKHLQWESDVRAVANALAATCPKFMFRRWMDFIWDNCGPNGGKVL